MKRALLFAINNYLGDGDLQGCLNDQENVSDMALVFGFAVTAFRDSEVTSSKFLSELQRVVSSSVAGDEILIHYSGHGTQVFDTNMDEDDYYDEALYLYDRPVRDDELNVILSGLKEGVTCTIMLDSCFSGDGTKRVFGKYKRFRKFRQTAQLRKSIFRSPDMKWILLSGCGETQTSADAFIGGNYSGAFTWYAVKSLSKGMTYKQWYNKIRSYLPSKEFDQIPQFEGNPELFNRVVFGGGEVKRCRLSRFLNRLKNKL
jgi:uncharacterized caspase-like protein